MVQKKRFRRYLFYWKRSGLKPKVEGLDLSNKTTKHADVARRHPCSERTMSSLAEKVNKGEDVIVELHWQCGN